MKFRNCFFTISIFIICLINVSCLYINTHKKAMFNNIPDELCPKISILEIRPYTKWESNNFDKDETNDNLFFEIAKEESFDVLGIYIGNCNDVILHDFDISDIEVNLVTKDEKSIPVSSYRIDKECHFYYDEKNYLRFKICEEKEKTGILLVVGLGESIKIQNLKELSVKMTLFNNDEFLEVNRVYDIKKVENKLTVLPQILMEVQRR